MESRVLYSIDEIVLIPVVRSYVESRSQCHSRYAVGKLPLFIAPMSCLVDAQNWKELDDLGFNVILPRTVDLNTRIQALVKGRWAAFGLDEGASLLKRTEDIKYGRVCIDIANGHQDRSYQLCRDLRNKYPHMVIMVGNIAHPGAYREYAKEGANYVRIGIGSGQVCTTSVQTGMHYPMASLISECREIKESLGADAPCIVADGGFGYIDQIVKGLALGADYVMIGKIAASFPEACSDTIKRADDIWEEEKVYREYYGMSTEKAQRLMHPEPNYVPKHTEGTVRWIPVIDKTESWINDFEHALRSAMSYNSSFELQDFVGHVDWGIQNQTTFKAYIKS